MSVGRCECTQTRIVDGVAKYREIGIVQGNGTYLGPLFPASCTQSNDKSKYFIACHNHHAWNEINENANASSSTTILLILAVVCCLILLAVVIILYRKIKNLEGKPSNRNIKNEDGVETPTQS